jgi:hypothetical protein
MTIKEINHFMEYGFHNVIDGAPAARFTRKLLEFIGSGYGLSEDQTQTAIEGT